MAGNSIGKLFRLTTWGESHGKAVGVVVDGCPAGLALSEEDIQKELNRRRPGQSAVSTARQEKDRVEILSGVYEGKTTGMPISALVWNKDADSSKYVPLKDLFRPGHGDYTFYQKYGHRDWRGGGRQSGRETIGRVIGGAIAKKILAQKFISVVGYTKQIGSLVCRSFKVEEIEQNEVRCPDNHMAIQMKQEILKVKARGDSIGGIVEILVHGMPVGLGEPVFAKLEAHLGQALFSLGAVKGVEVGAGFGVAEMLGSENNDPLTIKREQVCFQTNRAGGILGGISNGEDLLLRLAVKPTPSISVEQNTVNKEGNSVPVKVEGRHDPCLCPRVVPIAESMVALVLVDHLMLAQAQKII